MKFLSVCSGIGAAELAWSRLNWGIVASADIEPFPNAVRDARFPGVPNLGDMTKFQEWPNHVNIDVFVGGTPCQSFSVAGLRKGLADPRGNLALTYLAIVERYRPEWVVWENVPGVLSSNRGRDFGPFLGGLAQLGYGFAYRVLDAQYFGVAQRRRRVFVVANLADWRRAAAVLFERESLCGDTPPRRETGTNVAALTATGVGTCGADDNQGQAGHLIPTVAQTLRARDGAKGVYSDCTDTLIPNLAAYGGERTSGPLEVATACRAKGGTGHGDFDSETFVCHGTQNPDVLANLAHTLGRNSGQENAVLAFQERGRLGGRTVDVQHDVAYALTAPHGGGRANERNICIAHHVRRLTPVECERLQGFPDGWTQIPWRGKPADQCPDGPRYKGIGNSMAVPVMEWIGRRIELVKALAR